MGAFEEQTSAGSGCPADMWSDDTGPDTCVNIHDLLYVIARWSTPGGAADIVTNSPCGDGIVNIHDLLAVIAAWGACSGGSCTSGGSLPTSIAECESTCEAKCEEDENCYNQCVLDCIMALCEAEIIDCD